jgi:hypothetical protein
MASFVARSEAMLVTTAPADRHVSAGGDRMSPSGDETESCYERSVFEANQHLWWESERVGRDLGHKCWSGWYRQSWPRFIRWRFLEHIEGVRRWREFRAEEFNLANRLREERPHIDDRVLLREIIEMLGDEFENLEIIAWGHRTRQPMETLRFFLERLDINEKRLPPHPAADC